MTTALLVSALTGLASHQPASAEGADSPESLRDLCHAVELCWLVVLTPPRDGPFLVEAKFPNNKRFVRPEDPYCDRREYWHVAGSKHTLLAVDCAEQWGPATQGAVRLAVEHGQVKMTYLELGYDDSCEKAVATVEMSTAKLVSYRRWAGSASANGSDCRRLRPLKVPAPADTKTTPLVPFHSSNPP